MIHFHTDPFPASSWTLPFWSNSSNLGLVLSTLLKQEGWQKNSKIYTWVQIILKFAMYLAVQNKAWTFRRAFEQEFVAQKCRSFGFMWVFIIWGRSNVYINSLVFYLCPSLRFWYCFDLPQTDFIHSESAQYSM